MINARVSATLCKTTMSSKRYGRLLVGNLDGDYYLSDSIAMWRVPQKAIDRNIFTDLPAEGEALSIFGDNPVDKVSFDWARALAPTGKRLTITNWAYVGAESGRLFIDEDGGKHLLSPRHLALLDTPELAKWVFEDSIAKALENGKVFFALAEIETWNEPVFP